MITFSINKHEDVQIVYLIMRPFQPKLQNYPFTKHGIQNH